MTELITCGCGYEVMRGCDCPLCGQPADVLIEQAAAVTELASLRTG